MPVNVNGTTLRCSCGNTEALSITDSDSQSTTFTCMGCGETSTVEHGR
jgi:hypothetical protein